MAKHILYSNEIPINGHLSLHIPTIGEILDYGEHNYYQLVSTVIATSKDYMVPLDDMGIDYEAVSDFDLFIQLIVKNLSESDTSILFGDLNLSAYEVKCNTESNELVFFNEETQNIIDRYTYFEICEGVRWMHHYKKDNSKAANIEAKKFLIECARRKQKRAKDKKSELILEPLIVSLVNCNEFKYDYLGVKSLTIYQFYSSLQAVQKRIHYDQVMAGMYAGTVSSKDINLKEVNWLGSSD